jgi:hypothetical protein
LLIAMGGLLDLDRRGQAVYELAPPLRHAPDLEE